MKDASSHANPEQARVVHLNWTAQVDFDTEKISALAELHVEYDSDTSVALLKLDVKHIVLHSVAIVDEDSSSSSRSNREEESKGGVITTTDAKYRVHPMKKEHMGQCLEIHLPIERKKCKVQIQYETTEGCSAAQWLPPAQTAGKVHPYLFTQCQAIHARSLVPCQDCPGVKMTYTASVTVPSWATCLMSALARKSESDANNGTATFYFEQPIPIPSYLIAVVVGDLKGIDISHRCRIWSEPSVVDAAAFEFSQTEEFLQIAESLTLPYQWGRYDVLCLPPSFPYGGMENPCLTFVTPTLLAGDKSLADVVAHEIAHSWTGNLVTNETWEHFWLNEGWTTWLERKIMSKISGDDRVIDFDAIGGWEDLKESVDLMPDNYSKLVPNLGDEDPDEAYSSVPYEKGFNLLFALEKRVGTERFGDFVKAYLDNFKFMTVTSEEFRDFFGKYFENDSAVADFDWDSWLYKEGMPIENPSFDRTLSKSASDLASAWIKFDDNSEVAPKVDITGWSSKMKTCFLDSLLSICDDRRRPLNYKTINAMTDFYSFNETRNSEVLFRWCKICLEAGKTSINT